MLTAYDINGYPMWSHRLVFQGKPVVVKRVRGTSIENLIGYVGDVTPSEKPGVLNVLVHLLGGGEPGIGHQFVCPSTDLERLFCSCRWEDDGDGETGPTPFVAEPDPECEYHNALELDEPVGYVSDGARAFQQGDNFTEPSC